LRAFRGAYIDTAKHLKAQQDKKGDEVPAEVQQLDFEFVLFASAVVDYDYIMGLIALIKSRLAFFIATSSLNLDLTYFFAVPPNRDSLVGAYSLLSSAG
jgi:hypothetical protein